MSYHLITDASQLNGYLLSYAQPCPPLTFVEFLRRAHGERRVHWENARERLAFAGYGVALEMTANGESRFHTVQQMASMLFQNADSVGERPLLFGGFAFQDDFVSQTVWEGMQGAHFVLPKVMLKRVDGQPHLILSVYVPSGSDLNAAKAQLERDFERCFDDLFWNFSGEHWNPEWEEASHIEYPMPYNDWEQIITTATDQMKNGALDKVVLARMAQIRFSNPVNIVRALEYLRESYPDCHRFLFEPQPHNAFYGATPETLVKVSGDRVYADALAGTVKRGATPEDDDALGGQILADPKERHEHDLVVQSLRCTLSSFVQSVQADDNPGLLKLSNVQHLHTPVSGTLNDDYGVLSLVEALHPTPALGGQPRGVADDLIRELEPITRGWYAAPIGWIDSQMDGHFGVGIRSAVTREGTVWCYAGAGIVADSVPDREWNETDLKFRPMLNAIGVEHVRAQS